MVSGSKVVVVGAGIGGLAAALDLAAYGFDVTVLDRADTPGGKMREITVGGRPIDSGPTVLTMRWVFDALLDNAGLALDDYVTLHPAEILARHAWQDGSRLDLFADLDRSTHAIANFAGPKEASRFLAFCERARATYATLEHSFITASKPTPASLTLSAGLQGFRDLWRISPFTTLWDALGTYFHDERLRQLFARYATYCGSSPFEAPATLMLIAHVEQEGVWLVEGGMHRLARTLEACAKKMGVTFRYKCDVSHIDVRSGHARAVILSTGEQIEADIVLVNADVAALATGRFGKAAQAAVPATKATRSLSAITLSMTAKAHGFPLVRHNVFFSQDYRNEFHQIFGAQEVPGDPTVYVCAQDRNANLRPSDGNDDNDLERLFCLINAPPVGDTRRFSSEEIERCQDRVFHQLQRFGLKLEPEALATTTPEEFDRLYPATGGSLYGQASHGWGASFARPTARTRIPGIYLAGGSTHPGAGVPMAALSGRLAAASIVEDRTSAKRFPRTATFGGMSTA